MHSPRVLVLSGSAGHGHVAAGEAVSEAIRDVHPTIDVAHRDALEWMARWYAKTYRWGYVRLVDRHPLLWRSLYESTDRRLSAAGHALTVLGARELTDASRRWRPHAIVCTHFLAPEILSREIRKGRLDTQLHIAITDHDCHRMWFWPETTRYYVASDLVKARLVLRYGFPPERVTVTGIPVRQAFTQRRDPRPLRVKMGLDPGRPTVLFLTGGFAAGDLAKAIQGLWADRPDAQVVAVCGRNVRLRRRVEALTRPPGATLRSEGFTTEVADRMTVADVVVSKSGGITTAECMALAKPMVLCAAIPGQEERNADALVAARAAIKAPTPEEVRWHLARLLDDPDELAAMARAAKAFGRPNAAAAVAAEVARAVGEEVRTRTPTFHGAF